MFEQSEFMNFSFENNINKIIFHQQNGFLLIRFLCPLKENEYNIFNTQLYAQNTFLFQGKLYLAATRLQKDS